MKFLSFFLKPSLIFYHLLLLSSSVTRSNGETIQVGVGDEICIAGYIMDMYCIELGTLLENNRVETLGPEGPVVHTVHCLIDVRSCYKSPFEVLVQLENSSNYGRAWRLDNNDDVIKHAKENGVCRECREGNSVSQGHIKEGYRITMNAKVTSLGESGSTPATIEVLEIHDYDQFDTICEGKQYEIPNMVIPSDGTDGGGGGISLNTKIIIHGGLMLIGWGFLLPLGAIVAKFGKHRANSWWFKLHRIIQPIGLLVAIISWIYALVNFSALEAKGSPTLHYPHAVCGITTMVIGSLQPLNALFRPHPPQDEGGEKSTLRFAWEIIHKGLGWFCIILALATIGMGITLLPQESSKKRFKVGFGILIGMLILVLLCLLRESMNYDRKKVPTEEKRNKIVEEN